MDLTLGFYFSIAVAGWLTFGSIHGRKAGAGTRPFAFFGLIIALWSVGELIVADAATPEARILARRIFFLGAAGLAPTWFWLSVRSAAPDWYMRRPQLIIAAFLAPAFFYSCLFWDRSVRFVDWTSLVPAHGPWFDIFTTYQYLLSMLGTYYFAKTAMRLGRSSVRVMSALIVGFGLPLVANLLYYFGQLGTDWTAVALGPAGILLWISVIESGLTSGLPIDRDDVIEQLEVGVIVADPADQIVSVNAAAERLAGMQGLRGRSLKEVLVAAEQRPDVVIESRRMALHGRFSVIGHALILSDRTDAERARRRLELGGRLEALGSLTAGIAHEVNNPLAFIQANLCSLDTTSKRLSSTEVCKNLPTELRESAKEMAALVEETQEGVERIRLLVNRLLNFSRMPDLRATAIEIDLESGVRKAAAVAEIGQTGQPISIVGTRGLRLVSIESAVFQILVNLLLNAVQAGSDEPKVTVEMAEKEAGVSVRIEDEGPGIPAVILSRIFDPFFTTKPMGTGLGLSLSYDLSVQLGGHLEASNREGGGAVFELWLPLSPPEPPTASSAHADDPPARVA
jgi:signal transduction histidine kinase